MMLQPQFSYVANLINSLRKSYIIMIDNNNNANSSNQNQNSQSHSNKLND